MPMPSKDMAVDNPTTWEQLYAQDQQVPSPPPPPPAGPAPVETPSQGLSTQTVLNAVSEGQNGLNATTSAVLDSIKQSINYGFDIGKNNNAADNTIRVNDATHKNDLEKIQANKDATLAINAGLGEQTRLNTAAQAAADSQVAAAKGAQDRQTAETQGAQQRMTIGSQGEQDRLTQGQFLAGQLQQIQETGSQTRQTAVTTGEQTRLTAETQGLQQRKIGRAHV